ncbi:hypothetical protein HMPREF1221_00967 [Treponema socranskii subsp. paredis ATCC 35535]|nr:hypothetical protein HMPREF1221_00967 [Treponema socranskii subsp. paredis ATCC 35535]
MSNGRLMLDQHDDFIVNKTGDIVTKGHVHHLFEPERLDLCRRIETGTVERIIKLEKICICVFVFAEEIDEDGIFIAAIVFCHKISVKMLNIEAVIYIAEMLRFRKFFEKNREEKHKSLSSRYLNICEGLADNRYMALLLFFIASIFFIAPANGFAQDVKPLYELPSSADSGREGVFLAGSDKGLYRIAPSNTAIPLWTDGKVEQIVRIEAGENFGERWYFRTSKGIVYSENLADFELRNKGIAPLLIKKYDGKTVTLTEQVPILKDLAFDPLNPLNMATATENDVYITSDGGKEWKSIGSTSRITPGVKAVAIATMEGGALAVFESHPIFGLSYIFPYAKNAAWQDVPKGIKMPASLTSPDEISDIYPLVRTKEDGTKYAEIYFAQSYLPNLYRFDWNTKMSVCIYQGTEPADSIESIASVGSVLVFTRIESLGSIDAASLQSPGIPANFESWKRNFSCVPGIVNAAWVPKSKSGLAEGLLLGELWMLYPGTINTPYAEKANRKKGVYMPPNRGSEQTGIDNFRKLINNNNLNALVIDMKDDYGLLRYKPRDPFVAEKGRVSQYAVDVDHFVSEFKKDKVYLIARIVVFKDRNLAKYSGGKYAVWDAASKSPWVGIKSYDAGSDSAGKKTASYYDENWVDPYSEEVWEYNVAVAKELISRGFDEIQFDYIRFPTDGLNLKSASYRWQSKGMTKESALISFLSYARENIDAPIGIDIYGANGWYRSGTRTGQDAEMLGEYVDVISPMFYPNHFEHEFMNRAPYADRTYRIYYYGTFRASVMTRNRTIIRPWVQAFRLNVSYDRQYYGTEYVQKQIFGVRDSVDRGYLYWNNLGAYDYILPDVTAESKYIGTAPEADEKFRKPAFGSAVKPPFADETVSVLDSVLHQERTRKNPEAAGYTPFLYIPFMRLR